VQQKGTKLTKGSNKGRGLLIQSVVKSLLSLVFFFACGQVVSMAQSPEPLWTFDAPDLIRSSPAVAADGTVYFGVRGVLYAITNMGSNKWTFSTGRLSDCSPMIGPDGTIYYASMDLGSSASGYLYAISPDGLEKWRYLCQGGNGSPALGPDGTIYINGGFYLHAVSPFGTNRWVYPVRNGDTSHFVSPIVQPGQGICVGSYDDDRYYYISEAGSLVWRFDLLVSPGDSPAIGAGNTLLLTGNPLYTFTSNGTNLWSSDTNSFQRSSVAVGLGGTIYAPTTGGSLCAFSPSGQFEWQVLTNGYTPGVTPAIDSAGTIYYPAYCVFYAISAEGSVQWACPLLFDPGDIFGTSHTSPTIVPDGTIYVTSANRLYAFAGTHKLADSPWPMYRQNPRHTGKIEKPSLQQLKRRPDANIEFQLYAQINQNQTVQASTDLVSWTEVANVMVTNVPMTVVDLSATNFPSRFYRTASP
jgi:hypothetical protein